MASSNSWLDRRELPGGWQVVAEAPRRHHDGAISVNLVLQNERPRYVARATVTDTAARSVWADAACEAARGLAGRDHPPPSRAAIVQSLTELAVSAMASYHEQPGARAPESPPLTDYGNAQRLVAAHGTDLRYCARLGGWFAWDGQRWASDEGGEVMRRAKRTVRPGIYDEAAATDDPGAREALARHAVASERRARLESMIKLAESEPGIPIGPDAFDEDPWLLNVSNGTIDLRTGELRPHRRDDLLTRLAPAPYDPAATCPTWLAFLDRVLGERAELVAFLWRAVGYTLTGATRERVLLILHGSGRNGKSTLIETVTALLGDYAVRVSAEALLARREGSISSDLARLKGARFAAASETDDGRRLAEATIKQLTGGDTITARLLYAEPFDFKPEAKIWLATNHRPTIRGTDAAIWDRVRLIPFDVRIADEEVDPTLPERLRAELPGILAWAVAGCLEWQRVGLRAPEEVAAATANYRAEQDVIGAWLADCCLVAPTTIATAAALYTSFARWCESSGERAMSQRALGLRLAERGFTQGRAANGRHWQGLGLLASDERGE